MYSSWAAKGKGAGARGCRKWLVEGWWVVLEWINCCCCSLSACVRVSMDQSLVAPAQPNTCWKGHKAEETSWSAVCLTPLCPSHILPP